MLADWVSPLFFKHSTLIDEIVVKFMLQNSWTQGKDEILDVILPASSAEGASACFSVADATCSPFQSSCSGDCCADTTRCEISVTGSFYSFSASDCTKNDDGNPDCSLLSQGDNCPIACNEDSFSSSIYLAVPNGQDVTEETCFAWPGAAGQNSQNQGSCGDGSYTWQQ